MAAGDVVNTAARLQAAAPLNGVLVGEQTYRATVDAIEYERAEPVVAKGKRRPVAVWRALQARSRVGVDVAQRAVAPLVGRTRELDLLAATLERVREERAPQLVTLVGVPGIGKSRLVWELFAVVDREAELISWRQGRSLPYGDGVTFWALAEIVKAEAGILETDSREQARAKLAQAVARLDLSQSEADWVELRLGPLAGLAEATPAEQDEAFAAWRRFLEALAEQRPLVIVFEDLHWADAVLLDFVDQLVDRASGVPLLVVVTARPELLQSRPGWGGGKPNALTISLAPLSDDETAMLVASLLDRELHDDETLLARVGGNPLYAEQYTRVLLEGGDLLELPETVQGIIAARLDALTNDEKRLLQAAAVVGKVFWLGAVAAVEGATRWDAEELLHALERKEFVQRARRSSVASEHEYSFRHVLIRDVAYGQIPRALRSQLHRRAAEWIESLGRPAEQAELLAHHYLQALELREAAGLDGGELRESARRALRDAGERAAALYAGTAAERFFDAALRLEPQGAERAELLFRRALPLGHHVGGGDPARLAEARDALLAAGDRARAAEAEMLLAQSYWIKGERPVYELHAARALELLEGAQPSRATVWILARLATRASIEGDHDRSLELASEALAVSERLGSAEGASEISSLLGIVRLYRGDAGGLDDLKHGVELAESTGILGVKSRALNTLAVGYQVVGDLDAAYATRAAAADLAEGMGAEPVRRWFDAILADHHYRRGAWQEARAATNEFVAAIDAGSPHLLAYQVYGTRALIRVASGDLDGAVADAEASVSGARAVGEVQAIGFALPLQAYVLTAAGEHARGRERADEVIGLLRAGVNLQFGVINLPVLTSAAVDLGRGDDLVAALAQHPATRWSDAARAYVAGDFTAAAELLDAAGARPDAAEARLRAAGAGAHDELERARSFFRSVGATRFSDRCDALAQTTEVSASHGRGGGAQRG